MAILSALEKSIAQMSDFFNRVLPEYKETDDSHSCLVESNDAVMGDSEEYGRQDEEDEGDILGFKASIRHSNYIAMHSQFVDDEMK